MRKTRVFPTGVNSHCGRCLSALIILLLGAASLSQAQPSRFAAAYYNRGNERFKKGDLDGAIADYDAAIKSNPRWVPPNLSSQSSCKPRCGVVGLRCRRTASSTRICSSPASIRYCVG